MAHLLNLYIPDSDSDCRVLDIWDISEYQHGYAIQEPTIKIKIPGSDCYYYPVFKVKGRSHYTSNTFSLTSATCAADLVDLPDGIYEVTYSLCPEDELYYTVKFMRTCATECRIMTELSPLIGSGCTKVYDTFGKDITTQRITDLYHYLSILKAAKADVKGFKFTEAEYKLNDVCTKLNLL